MKIGGRKASHNIEPRMAMLKVIDVYTNRGNGFNIPRNYDYNHLTLGRVSIEEQVRAMSPASREREEQQQQSYSILPEGIG